eukprot:TRINITY_DN84396_c0_g1_i1.p1 TRINITY_DN84396_c0_g1~~TRINITY_DN84396_c0_g1_i1.p1  ORF type:complete len:123 (-),score=13.53 TRINITY_DN84396_c0_g1_i1:176-544(-)
MAMRSPAHDELPSVRSTPCRPWAERAHRSMLTRVFVAAFFAIGLYMSGMGFVSEDSTEQSAPLAGSDINSTKVLLETYEISSEAAEPDEDAFETIFEAATVFACVAGCLVLGEIRRKAAPAQ